jgi:cobyrinic acid a,c-diamide synthase
VLDAPSLDRLVASIEGTVSIDELVGLARPSRIEEPAALSAPAAPRARIGVARDRAFCFYYQDNLDLLSRSGAELVEFSPISDARLPERLDGLYLGGGYPELHATALAANTAMRAEVDRFARSGRPVYAECGGLMYLTEAIVDVDGAAHPMVGIFPTRARMGERLAAIGYVEVELTEGSGWAPAGARARGHEFRYSTIDPMACEVPRRYRAESHGAKRADGFAAGGVLASYVHLHFHSCPELAARFVAACADHRKEMQCIDRKG